MITITKNGNAVLFEFEENSHYLFNGTIEVPLNSLTLVTDESEMFTFKKAATNDIFISARYDDVNMSKSQLIDFYIASMVGGGGGGSQSGVTSGEVQTMIDGSISGKADTSAVTQEISAAVSGKADSSSVYTKSEVDAALSGKQDTLIAGSGITISGNVISSEGGNNVIELTQAEYDALVDKDPSAFYIITDAQEINLSDYYTSAQTQSAINAAVSGKQDTLIAGSGITISGNVISAQGGGSITIDPTLDSGSTNAVANSAITNALNSKIQDFRTNSNSQSTIRLTITKNGWSYSDKDLLNLYNGLITRGASGLTIDLSQNQEFKTYSAATDALLDDKFDASAFTSYSAATDARMAEDEEVTAAGINAVNDKFDGLRLKKLSQAEYNALTVKNNDTLYILVG